MSASLVGSEMCIRDRRARAAAPVAAEPVLAGHLGVAAEPAKRLVAVRGPCLLYTSDAADDM
eukprot:12287719-Alexandrium_andersonii.AAC.1